MGLGVRFCTVCRLISPKPATKKARPELSATKKPGAVAGLEGMGCGSERRSIFRCLINFPAVKRSSSAYVELEAVNNGQPLPDLFLITGQKCRLIMPLRFGQRVEHSSGTGQLVILNRQSSLSFSNQPVGRSSADRMLGLQSGCYHCARLAVFQHFNRCQHPGVSRCFRFAGHLRASPPAEGKQVQRRARDRTLCASTADPPIVRASQARQDPQVASR